MVTGGVVSGTWNVTGDDLTIDWFGDAGPPPADRLEAEIARLGRIMDRQLRTTVTAI